MIRRLKKIGGVLLTLTVQNSKKTVWIVPDMDDLKGANEETIAKLWWAVGKWCAWFRRRHKKWKVNGLAIGDDDDVEGKATNYNAELGRPSHLTLRGDK